VSSLSLSARLPGLNLPQTLAASGHDTFLLDYRASPALPSASTRFDLDDVALRDWPAAVEAVRTLTGADSVVAFGHCVGSMTLLMARLAGLQGVRALVCSQLSTHPVTTWLTRAKAWLRLADMMDALGVHTLDTNPGTGLRRRLMDLVVAAVPVDPEERCDSPVCRRIFAMYGPSYRHACLDPEVHEAIPAMFGISSVPAFRHITRILRAGHVVDAKGRDTYLPRLERLNLPILFLAGAKNRLFLPDSTRVLHDMLVQRFGTEGFERLEFTGYAHMDCFLGRDAARDVFPGVLDFLARQG
jgi:cholesterol oxidase